MPTTLLFAPPPRIFRPTYGPVIKKICAACSLERDCGISAHSICILMNEQLIMQAAKDGMYLTRLT